MDTTVDNKFVIQRNSLEKCIHILLNVDSLPRILDQNRDRSWCQPCRHWRHHRLSLCHQFAVPPLSDDKVSAGVIGHDLLNYAPTTYHANFDIVVHLNKQLTGPKIGWWNQITSPFIWPRCYRFGIKILGNPISWRFIPSLTSAMCWKVFCEYLFVISGDIL